MAADVKQNGLGSVLYIKELANAAACNLDITALTGFASYGCSYSIGVPGIEYETITEDTCLDSTAAPATTLGNVQPDEIPVTRVFDPAGDQTVQLRDWAENYNHLQFCIVYPDGGVDTFCGQIQRYKPIPLDASEFMKVEMNILRNGGYKHFTPGA